MADERKSDKLPATFMGYPVVKDNSMPKLKPGDIIIGKPGKPINKGRRRKKI